MAVFKCKMCGGTLEISDQSIAICEYCGTKQTLPKTKDDGLQSLFNRAHSLRLKCEFDKAAQVYEKIVEQDNTQAEAYWGLVLCKYGIEYVEEPGALKRVPTCHRTLYEAVTADADFHSTMEYADPEQREIYMAEANAIDKIQKDIISIVKNEKPFDVFICYKETDEEGKRTVDSTIANDIYYQLTQEGFKVFYAAITLEDKLGQEYEPYIFAALNSAKVMLVISTKPEYFNAVWVRNEWSRFLNFMKTDRNKLLIPCYRDMDAYELPEEFSHLQAQDMGKIGFINDVVRGIKKVIMPEKTSNKNITNSAGNITIETLLKRVFIFLEDGDFRSAHEYCEKVLDIEPENAWAYLGRLMIDLKVRKQEELKYCRASFNANGNYQKAIRYAGEELKNVLIEYNEFIINRIREEQIRKEQERVEGIYQNGVQLYNSRQFGRAEETFLTISQYKDATEYVNRCREELAKIRKKEKHRRLRKKIIKLCVFLIIVSSIVFIVVYNGHIVPTQKYEEATQMMKKREYYDAYVTFNELRNFKDSRELADICQRRHALREKLQDLEIGSSFCFGMYEQDNYTSSSVEEIEWIVLDKTDDKILVISRRALDCKPYNEEAAAVTWENCSLRTWLNNDFIKSAFNEDEMECIIKSSVSADDNLTYSTDAGNETHDQVFLLSSTEALRYFELAEDRLCDSTNYAVAKGAALDDVGYTAYWWLRTPGEGLDKASGVNGNGDIFEQGGGVNSIHSAVRPAMWIDIS